MERRMVAHILALALGGRDRPALRVLEAEATKHLVGTDPRSIQKDDLGSPHMLLGTVAICGHSLQMATDGRRNGEGYFCAHPTDSQAPPKQESPYGIQMLKFI